MEANMDLIGNFPNKGIPVSMEEIMPVIDSEENSSTAIGQAPSSN